jgi:hypothetical protein
MISLVHIPLHSVYAVVAALTAVKASLDLNGDMLLVKREVPAPFADRMEAPFPQEL